MNVILASQSPRRRELLEGAGVSFVVRVSEVDEGLTPEQQADPAAAACLLADRKAGVVVQELLDATAVAAAGTATPGTAIAGVAVADADNANPAAAADGAPGTAAAGAITEPTMVIGADTMVVLDGRIFGKPHTPSEATGMLRKLAGRTHEVITGVSVWGIMPGGDGKVSAGHTTFHETSQVTFRALSDDEIAAYVAQGECFDKAGSYAIQGTGGQFVERYEGPLDNIIGLPVSTLLERFPDMLS